MSNAELQEEEKEVLLSIYEGDPAFNMISDTTYQYKFGEDGDPKSFLFETNWGETYPTEMPTLNMELFYNKHLTSGVKSHIKSKLTEECEQYLGSAMTYTIFEYLRDNTDDLLAAQPEEPSVAVVDTAMQSLEVDDTDSKKEKVVKKEAMSKAQKRKQWERSDGKGEKPRGWDWVDIVKHLSQTGGKPDS
uniref:RWD domain-containing protein 4 n=1 Tax=Cacopsylla melanoneura TaxID=428564 RepID=A0A8D8Q9T6_9HEMI